MWILGLWVEARTRYHALTANNPQPQTRADQKKKVADALLKDAKKWRQKHDKEFMAAISDPREFGAFVGLPHILGEPERRPEKTREEKVRAGYDAAKRALVRLFGSG